LTIEFGTRVSSMTLRDDHYFIPSSYSRIVAREMGLQERELVDLLRGTNLPVEVLMPGDETRLTGRQQLRVLDNAQRMIDAPDFGLRLGRQLNPAAHGPLGYLALSSPDLLTGLESLRDFLPARIPFVQLEVKLGDDWLRCALTLKLAASENERRILQECFALVLQSIVETLLGEELRTARVDLCHARPRYHRRYRDYLHCPVRFGAGENLYRIPAELARAANASGDPASYSQAQAICQRLLEQAPVSDLTTADRVRRYLLSQPAGTVTEADVAQALFISKRTLARRLEREGSSYRAIHEKLMAEMAARHMRESGLTVEAVAALLGYNDAAAFRKAFRRWHGQSPSEFRTRCGRIDDA
jgi:AraC-like DNA-binding protein